MSYDGIEIRVKGKVQGVGFRPFVWQLAHQLSLKGEVCNDSQGVLIRFLSDSNITEFIARLYKQIPPLARIDDLIESPYFWSFLPTEFNIVSSSEGTMDTQILPDAKTCEFCLHELFDKTNRRYHYPFINCTHCGPRFSIIKKIPYDRVNTAMSGFELCPECQKEYNSVFDRRFHAQPNACALCGPHIWSSYSSGKVEQEGEDALEHICQAIICGKIVAMKGIGGFHLVCDATNDNAVSLLRQRKHRPGKAFAVMLPGLEWLDKCTNESSNFIRQMLSQSAAPIVLVSKKEFSAISQFVAPDLAELGVMLPSNPLQHLLARYLDRPVVMTSGNRSGYSPALSNSQALQELSGIADIWLLHNRDILQRVDDSVVKPLLGGKIETIRRARGYVPDAFKLEQHCDSALSVLGMGADLKNTFSLARKQSVVVSQHIGDLTNLSIQKEYEQQINLFEEIYRFSPDLIVIDAHPGYISSRIGRELAKQRKLPVLPVLHHHAHVVACLAEHRWSPKKGPVIGITVDGLGYGGNHQLWGGECLLVDYANSCHLGGLPAVPLPGGDVASRQPWRNLFSHLLMFVPDWQQYRESLYLPEKERFIVHKAIEKNINSPLASSGGRLFDAVAAALGICPEGITWEGEAACKLEVLARRSRCVHVPVSMPLIDSFLDLGTFWNEWLNYSASKEDKAFAFHYALAKGFATLAKKCALEYQTNTIVLTGGCMHNQLFRTLLCSHLQEFTVLTASQFPSGDGAISLGQAVIGIHHLLTH